MTQILRLVKEFPLTNTGFEGGSSPWTQQTGTDVAQSSAFKHSGVYSLKGRNTGSGNNIMNYEVTLPAATTFIFGAWVYIGAGEPTLTQAHIRIMTSGFGALADTDFLTQANATRDSWFFVSVKGTTTTAAAYNINVYFAAAAAHAEYMDDARLYQQLLDFQGTSHSLKELSEYGFGEQFGSAKLNFDVRGTSLNNVLDNFITLGRALTLAKENKQAAESGAAYAPVWLQLQPASSTNLQQTEVLGLTKESQGALEKIIAHPETLLSNRIENVTVPLLVRGYWEETAMVSVSGSPFTSDNGTGSMTISGLRGDVARLPLRIKNRAATTNQTQTIAFLKTKNTPANFVEHFDLNTAAGTGYTVTLNTGLASTTVANQTDADDFINGKGCRVTPSTDLDASGEIDWLVRVLFTTNPAAFTGRARAVVRMRDNHATTPKAYLRARSVLVNASGTRLQAGDWWDVACAAQVVSTTGGVPQAWVDCGAGKIPVSHFGGATPYQPGIEIGGYTTDTSGHATFDLDELFLLMGYEGDDCGLVVAVYPQAHGNGAIPDGVLDANDRVPEAYMVDASDVILVGAETVSGPPLYAYPERSQVLFLHTRRYSNGVHTHGVNNTVVVDYMPRYRLARGT